MDAGEEDGKVPDVHGILLLEVDLQLCFGEAPGGEMIPRPVMLSVHRTEKGLKKS